MADKITIKPAPGLSIPNPATGRDLAPGGETVGNTVYWRRRIREGAVVVVSAPAAEPDRKGK